MRVIQNAYSQSRLCLAVFIMLLCAAVMVGCGSDNNSSANNTNGSGTTPNPGSSNPGSNGGTGTGTSGGSSGGTTGGTTGGTGGTTGSTGGTSGGSGGSGSSAPINVYVANNGPKNVDAFRFDPAKGFSAVQGSPFASGDFAVDLAVSGNQLVESASSLKVWTIDSSTGALTPGTAVSGGYTWLATKDSTLYASLATNQGLVAFTNNNGKFAQISGPLSLANLCTECSSGKLQVSSDGKYVYSIMSGFRDLHGFAVIDRAADGTISNPRDTGQINNSTIGSSDIVVSADNQWVYEASTSTPDILLWHLDPATGKSSLVSDHAATLDSGPNQLLISPDGKYLAALSLGANRVSVYSIDSTTGSLTAVDGSPFATGVNPVNMTLSSNGQYLFVVCRGDGSADLTAYSVNNSTGALTQVAHQNLGGDPAVVITK